MISGSVSSARIGLRIAFASARTAAPRRTEPGQSIEMLVNIQSITISATMLTPHPRSAETRNVLPALRTRRLYRSVAVDFHQPLVADPEVVRDLVQHDPPHLAPQDLRVTAGEPLERTAVDRDLVGERAGVVGAAPRQRHALVEPEQRPSGRRLVLDYQL